MSTANQSAPTPRRASRTPWVLVGTGGLFAIILVVLVGLRLFVFQTYKMPSASMLPTLAVGERFFVNKTEKTMVRGGVIVFGYPEHPEQDFVKRTIGTGGDVVDVTGGHPIIDGWKVPSCKVGSWSYDEHEPGSAAHHTGDLYVEFLEQSAYLTFYDGSVGAFPDHQGPYTVKAGEAFVMGDNRNNSHDSRMWFGGAGGGVPPNLVRGSIGGATDAPRLPANASAELQAGLAKCLAARPAPGSTTPPAGGRRS